MVKEGSFKPEFRVRVPVGVPSLMSDAQIFDIIKLEQLKEFQTYLKSLKTTEEGDKLIERVQYQIEFIESIKEEDAPVA